MVYQPRPIEKDAIPTSPPAACPACRSSKIMTTSKVASVDSYWRCMACGEVWNAARREPPGRRRYQPFGR